MGRSGAMVVVVGGLEGAAGGGDGGGDGRAAVRALPPPTPLHPPPTSHPLLTWLPRSQVVTPEPPAWEVEYESWRATTAAAARGKAYPDELAAGAVAGLGGLQALDSATWTPAPRRTAADKAGDEASLERALDSRLFFVLGGAGGGSPVAGNADWHLPAALHEGEEPMRAAAERALAAAAAPAPGSAPLETYFVGHAPAGHLVLPGGPTFFFHRAQLITGTPAAAGGGTHAWLTKAELAERLGGGALGALLLKAL